MARKLEFVLEGKLWEAIYLWMYTGKSHFIVFAVFFE